LFSEAAIKESLPALLTDHIVAPETALRCWTTALVVAAASSGWRVADELTLQGLGERWLEATLAEYPAALRLQLRAAAAAQVAAWAAAQDAIVAAFRSAKALPSSAGASVLAALVVKHGAHDVVHTRACAAA
jgi:hypothetical protein